MWVTFSIVQVFLLNNGLLLEIWPFILGGLFVKHVVYMPENTLVPYLDTPIEKRIYESREIKLQHESAHFKMKNGCFSKKN